MKYRKLRIAWSVVCGILCLLLIVLWVRSFSYYDALEKSTGLKILQIRSVKGRLAITQYDPLRKLPNLPLPDVKSALDSVSTGRSYTSGKARGSPRLINPPVLGFGQFEDDISRTVVVPYWFPVAVTSTLAIIPWILWIKRFSLRTLLIGMTVVAVILGLAIWAAK